MHAVTTAPVIMRPFLGRPEAWEAVLAPASLPSTLHVRGRINPNEVRARRHAPLSLSPLQGMSIFSLFRAYICVWVSLEFRKGFPTSSS